MAGKMWVRRPLKKVSEGQGRVGNKMFEDFWNIPTAIVNRVAQMAQQGGLEQTDAGKLKIKTIPSAFNTPWYFIKHGMNRDCLLWHDTYFDNFDIIPSQCMNCWKTVIVTDPDPKKQTVLDLFKLRDLMIGWQLPSKCGVDIRDYTPQRYDAFIYGDSLEQGQEYQRFAQKRLEESGLFKNPKAILKRACTEFEQRHPDSTKWTLSNDQIRTEEFLEYLFDRTGGYQYLQWDVAAAQTFQFWIDRAHGIGDTTWRDALIYCGYEDPGESLWVPPVCYHNKTSEELLEMMGGDLVSKLEAMDLDQLSKKLQQSIDTTSEEPPERG